MNEIEMAIRLMMPVFVVAIFAMVWPLLRSWDV
jgi:hypothetical protein